MTQPDFEASLAVVLRVCRGATGELAEAGVSIDVMLEHVREAREGLAGTPQRGDLDALLEILGAVGDVAAIGAKLPALPRPIQVPDAPRGGSVPMPTNLTP